MRDMKGIYCKGKDHVPAIICGFPAVDEEHRAAGVVSEQRIQRLV